ncbi:MAG: hypothetical protein JKY95_06520 [Planctomycetaceae bacterium]|nr:hypothetical protein [Planctomycetaceae bacterium]
MNLITSSNRIGSSDPVTAWHLFHYARLVLVSVLLLSLPTATTKAEEPEAASNNSTLSIKTGTPILRAVRGIVVDAQTNKPIPNALVYGIYRNQAAIDLRTTTNESGEFHFEQGLHSIVVYAATQDRSKAGIVEIGPEDKTVTMPIRPLASTTGILMAGNLSKSLTNQEVVYGITVHLGGKDNPFRRSYGGKVKSDESGRFVLDKMVVGHKYVVLMTTGFDENGHGSSWKKIHTLAPQDDDLSDLGILVLKASYKPAILDEHISRAFDDRKDRIGLLKRFVFAKQKAKSAQQHILFVFGDPKSEAVRQFMQLRYQRPVFRELMDSYQMMAVNTTETHWPKVKHLAKVMQLSQKQIQNGFSLVVTNSQGLVLASGSKSSFETKRNLDQEKLQRFLVANAPEILDAQELFDAALVQAKLQDKRIIILETATWCDPCMRLARFLDKQSLLLRQDYIVLSLDHRWKNSKELMKQLRGDVQAGLPWWAIVDQNAEVLVTSNDNRGDNIGFPTGKNGIDHFRKMIEKTAIHMTKNNIKQLVEHLSKEK